MSGRTQLEHAAELLERLLPQTTPAPWRDTTVDGAPNPYHALVAPESACRDHVLTFADGTVDHWDEREAYGGRLVAETMEGPDRRLLAVMRNVADELPALLRAVAAEDPAEVGQAARGIAARLIDTHQPGRPL